MVKLAMMIMLLLSGLVFDAVTPLVFAEEVISFSSHWHAVIYSTVSLYRKMHSKIETRNIPVAGARQVGLPSAGTDMPHVIVVLLESASYSNTSLYDEKAGTTPFLAGLAEEGAEFTLTRVPVSHTTKACWSALTSSTPVIEGNYVEAIPADKPYESIATILKRAGYRSGFFEMSRGSFECGPGFFRNMGFDWAWFRENLGDESANIGYFGGDDLRVIEPAMDWLTGASGPGFVMMITSISHEPYDVPEWFEASEKEPYEKYLQTVRYTDLFLKKLCEEIARRGISENTLLCVIGDHGTSFRSDTNMARWCPYEEILRVPWVIRWPGHVEAGRKYDWPCSQTDVAPTILSLLGYDISRAGFEGRDAFVPGPAERRLYFSSWYTDSPMGYVEGNRKIVYWPYLRKVFEYDLQRDAEENSPRRIEKEDAEEIVKEILNWQHRSQMMIDPRRYTEDVFYSHWLTYSSGRSAWTYYAP
jgi:phosphoglycerol transferase MdoB-like AlkP superfamily enzyme